MSLKEVFTPNHLNKLLIVLAMAVVLIFVFSAGVLVGHQKARFSQHWGENYYRNIMGPGGRGMMRFDRPGFNPHSGFGQIIKIEGSSLIVRGPDSIEKVIVVDDKTSMQKFNQSLKFGDLRVDDTVVVIGTPDSQGQIKAKLIRVMPNPPVNPPMNGFFQEPGSSTTSEIK